MSYQGQQNRTEWYDRNPLSRALEYAAAGIGPHAETVRFTYTVPANRKFYLEVSSAIVIRDGVAAAPAWLQATISIILLGLSPNVATGRFINGAVGANSMSLLGASAIVLAGESIRGSTQDTSGDGTVRYALDFKGTEFDA